MDSELFEVAEECLVMGNVFFGSSRLICLSGSIRSDIFTVKEKVILREKEGGPLPMVGERSHGLVIFVGWHTTASTGILYEDDQ